MSVQHQEEAVLHEVTRALRERVKELDCLYGISDVVERAGGSLEQILEGAVALLPRSWQYPETACARIEMNGFEYRTENYADTSWKQRASICIHGRQVGQVEVGYLEQRPERDEGPFLAEERRLIDSIAQRLGHIGERLHAESVALGRASRLQERLTHLMRVSTMGELASSIAHEVNQPLNAIATYGQACRRLVSSGKLGDSEVLEILDLIVGEALRAGKMIHRLKDLVRRGEGKRIECDVNELVRGVEKLAVAESRLHYVPLRFELAETLPNVLADGIQIQQVVLNLVRNALDACQAVQSENGGIVVRTMRADGGFLRISVTDHGCGLPDVTPEELFQPFFTTKPNGMGVGLSICRSIVRSHGGRIWCSPDSDGGSTFSFTVPTVAGECT